MRAFILVLTLLSQSAVAGDVASQLASYFKERHLDGIGVKTIGKLIVVDGEVELPGHLEMIDRLIAGIKAAEPDVVVENLTQVCPTTWNRIAERVEREIGSPEITARVVGKMVMLEGLAESDFEADRSVEIAKIYFASPMYYRPSAKPEERAISSESNVKFNIGILDLLRVRPPGDAKKTKRTDAGAKPGR